MPESAKPHIAVIGLGSMGFGMATSLRRAGVEVTGCDVSADAVARFVADGGHGAKTPAEALKRNFDYINNKVLEMAQDFPADKYNYKLKPEMRSFGAVIVHIASGDIFAGKAGMGEKVK